jgi:hypothetical protein
MNWEVYIRLSETCTKTYCTFLRTSGVQFRTGPEHKMKQLSGPISVDVGNAYHTGNEVLSVSTLMSTILYRYVE